VVNLHPTVSRGANVLVDASLNGSAMKVALNTAQAAERTNYLGLYKIGSAIPLQRNASGVAYIAIRDLPPSEVLVLLNEGGRSV
jgi:hypothetical protein